MEELYKTYNYPSIGKFKEILKLNGINATHKEIKTFVNSYSVNELHKPTQNMKEKYKFIIAFEPYEMIQIDLLDYSKYSKTNKGYKYILIGVDVFTRYAYAIPIKSKTPQDVLNGFKQFDIKQLNAIYSDSGNEYKGVFSKYLKEKNINELKAEVGDHNSLGIIDRFSKTFKTMISKYMTANGTTKYFNVIDSLIDVYNNLPHSSIGNIQPINAFVGENYDLIKRINLEKLKHNKSVMKKQQIKTKVGNYVREKIKKQLFDKGYEITYSKQIYNVVAINNDKAELNDGRFVKLINLIVVNPNNPQPNINDERDEAVAQSKLNRRLNKEGIHDETLYW